MDDADLTALRIPTALRDRAREILAITDQGCTEHLDDEYAHVCRHLVGRLARTRPSPLTRGDTRSWAAGAIYAVGQVNFLFDRSQQPHMTADQLAASLGVVKTTTPRCSCSARVPAMNSRCGSCRPSPNSWRAPEISSASGPRTA